MSVRSGGSDCESCQGLEFVLGERERAHQGEGKEERRAVGNGADVAALLREAPHHFGKPGHGEGEQLGTPLVLLAQHGRAAEQPRQEWRPVIVLLLY
jgi:hypothetical protein